MSISGAMKYSSQVLERQADVVLGERGHAGARAGDVVELGKLHAALEWRVIIEPMQQRRHPPGEALRLPYALEADVGITVEQARRSFRVERDQSAREHAHVGRREIEPLRPGGRHD